MAQTIEQRVADLEWRVAEVEGTFGFLIPLTKQLHRELLGFRAAVEEEFVRTHQRSEKIDQRFERLEGRIDLVEKKQEVHTEMLSGLPRLIVEMLKTEGFVTKP